MFVNFAPSIIKMCVFSSSAPYFIQTGFSFFHSGSKHEMGQKKLHYVVLECRLEELPPLCLSRGSLQGYLQMGASLLVLNPLPAG